VNDYLNKTNNQPEKLIIGYPYFGFEWPATSSSAGAPTTDTGTAKFYAEMEGNALSYGKLWHETSQTPWYRYQNPNWVQGWYDDSLSLSLKYDFAINNDLLGVGIWAMGYDGSNPELWDLLSAKFGATAPPTTPTRLIIKNIGNGGVMINFQGSQAADAYIVLRSYLGSNTLDTLGSYTQRPFIINNLNTSETYFLSVSAMNGFGFSPQTELMGVIPSTGNVKCLIINGFDRVNGTNNTFDYIKQHGSAFHAQGYPFDNATNEAVIEGDVDLDNYAVVDWILGEEGTATSSFIGSEQDLVESYLENGGFLFVSGSEVGYDLSSQGSASDNQFFQNYLKANYISDAAGGQQGTYSGYGVTNSLFDGISDITFDNGTHGTYDVDWPDGIKPVNGAEVCVKFDDVDYDTRGGMGVSYTGTFGISSENGGIVFLSVGFETIYPESKRDQLLDRILNFYETELSIINNSQVALPEAVSIHALYPNPTNSSLTLEFLSDYNKQVVQIAIIDILGRKVKTVDIPIMGKYKNTWVWDGLNDFNRKLPAGIYVLTLTSGQTIESRKVTLLK
jgi:hypothetical protein